MRELARAAMLLYAVGLTPAMADEPQAPPAPATPKPHEQLTLEKFGEANKTCAEWSDGCAVCKRSDTGSLDCSTTGIACQPVDVTCRQTAQDKPKH